MTSKDFLRYIRIYLWVCGGAILSASFVMFEMGRGYTPPGGHALNTFAAIAGIAFVVAGFFTRRISDWMDT